MAKTPKKLPVSRSIRVAIDADTENMLVEFAQAEGVASYRVASLSGGTTALLRNVGRSLADFLSRRAALMENKTDVPADLPAAVDALAKLIAQGTVLAQLVPPGILAMDAIMARFALLTRIADRRQIEVVIPIEWAEAAGGP